MRLTIVLVVLLGRLSYSFQTGEFSSSEFLSSIALQLVSNDPSATFSKLESSLQEGIASLSSDLSSNSCSTESSESQISSLYSSLGMAKFKQSKLQSNLEKFLTQLNSYKFFYQDLQSFKDIFSEIQTEENKYLVSESQILKSSISNCENTIKEVTGDNFRVSNIFLQEGEIEELSDSLQFLNKLKRSLTKSWEFVEDFNEGINEKAMKIVEKYEQRMKKVQGKIEKSEKVLKDLEEEDKEIGKGIEDLIKKIKESEENLNKKREYCQGNKEKIEKEIERKGKQLDIVKKVVEEYGEDSEGTLKKLRNGEY
ncbi:hypothetical protein SteCoe_36539 [Stentor coeruleus]|uniref:Uncharacterized protein n=1 Tax=Stentor coeruleus TaxID=5963 RepID=A0A1R2AQ13_9CILI|nr:hypothetical protein SteCoe_36539 [Stentor coeruleus]